MNSIFVQIRNFKMGKLLENMQNQELDVNKYIEQMSLLLNLPIKDEYRDGVVANFVRIKAIAQLVNSFPLPAEVESAPVFEL